MAACGTRVWREARRGSAPRAFPTRMSMLSINGRWLKATAISDLLLAHDIMHVGNLCAYEVKQKLDINVYNLISRAQPLGLHTLTSLEHVLHTLKSD